MGHFAKAAGTGHLLKNVGGHLIICGPCPNTICGRARWEYTVTIQNVTLCPGWTGTVNGTYQMLWWYKTATRCRWRKQSAFILQYSGQPYTFWLYYYVEAAGVRLRILHDTSPWEVFDNVIGFGVEPVADCTMIGASLSSALTSCDQIIVGSYYAIATGGAASFA